MTGRPQVAVGAVAIRAGAVLLVQRGQEPHRGRWSIPGGRVEPGETLHEAVVRELREETGQLGIVDRFVGFTEHIDASPGGAHFVILGFHVVLDQANPPPVAAEDAVAAEWMPLEQLAGIDLVPGLGQLLATVASDPDMPRSLVM